MKRLLDKLNKEKSLTLLEYERLIESFDADTADYAKSLANKVNVYGNTVFIRGLIEISNICKNDCLYCGIRASNKRCDRFRLTKEQILSCCEKGYALGFRTFVLQGGEDGYFTDDVVCDIVKAIKTQYPDCAVTLSLGERTRDSYKKLREAGADRYLLRHETADREHYEKLHPQSMSFDNRMKCLYDLKELGFQVGCGFMVGSPYQSGGTLAKDLKFIEEFCPQMCGIGPYLPHRDTPFKGERAGDTELTLYLLSILRIMHPNILLPATTALGTASHDGRERGILAGANVIMPNLSPENTRDKYELYNNKLSTGAEGADGIDLLREKMNRIGYTIEITRGDYKKCITRSH